jgi:LmbE family N-acetylglucosaminyl deacetylase
MEFGRLIDGRPTVAVGSGLNDLGNTSSHQATLQMRLDFTGNRILAVVAHPDDAELLCAGTLARARAERAEIGVCVLCKGDKGQPSPPIANLAAVRRAEMRQSAALLGATLFCGGYSDGTLTDGLAERRRLTELFRRFVPTLVLAHAPQDYHPDHRAASALAEAASWFCASRGQKTRSQPLAAPPALWWLDCINGAGFGPHFYVDVSSHADLKRQLLACHRSQLQRAADRDFAPLAELMQRQMSTRGAESGVAAAEAFRLHHAFKRLRAW